MEETAKEKNWKCKKDIVEIVIVIGTIVSACSNACGYLYSMGSYEFWNIPYDYITINSKVFLFHFVIGFCCLFILGMVITFLIYLYQKADSSRKKKSRMITLLVGCFISSVVFLIILIGNMCGFKEVFQYIMHSQETFLGISLVLTVIFFLCLFGLGMVEVELLKWAKKGGVTKWLKDKDVNKYLTLITCSIVYLISMMLIFFDSGKIFTASSKEFETVIIEDIKYIVIESYNDYWIVKPMYIEEGREIISENFMFCDLEGVPLERWELEASDSISNYIIGSEQQYEKNNKINDLRMESKMESFMKFCNYNEGFLSAILSALALIVSILTIYMTWKVGKMPFKKNVSIIPTLYKEGEDWYIDLFVINSGNATICISTINIFNNQGLNIGMMIKEELMVLKPCNYVKKKIKLCDDLENVEKHQMDLNGYLVIVAYDVDGKKYKFTKGYPVG